MLKSALSKILDHHHLTREEAALAMNCVMEGDATAAQIAAFLIALRMQGETVEEITGFAQAMRAHATHIHPQTQNLVDTCGTGGDVAGTFNISTAAAIVASGAGVTIAKHGNRSVSSKCGSADVLEILGVKIDLEAQKVEASINKLGIGFIYAPIFHPAIKHAMPARREIGVRTVFNILGPLTNPAGARRQVLGVFSAELTDTLAQVLKNLGAEEALVVHGMDGLDEITLCEKTKVSHLKNGHIKNYFVTPEDFGLPRAQRTDLLGGSAADNAAIIQEILAGKKTGSQRDIVLLNAAAAIYVGGKAKDINDGIKIAAQAIDSGAAAEKLRQLVEIF